MAIAFLVISVLGMVVFFKAGDWPVGLVFVGLTCVYVSELLAGLFRRNADSRPRILNTFGVRALGFSRLATAAWLMCMTFSVTLNTTSGTHLPV
jgi:hypothetical protein